MPRRKPLDLWTFLPDSASDAEKAADVAKHVTNVLTAANLYLKNPAMKAPGPRQLHEHLELLSDGVHIMAGVTWPAEARVGFDTIVDAVRAGHRHLRRCRICRYWFLATDARRFLCADRSQIGALGTHY